MTNDNSMFSYIYWQFVYTLSWSVLDFWSFLVIQKKLTYFYKIQSEFLGEERCTDSLDQFGENCHRVFQIMNIV